MPKDPKHNLTDKLCLKYPNLIPFKLDKGRFNLNKKSNIYEIINEEEKDEFIKLFYKKKN